MQRIKYLIRKFVYDIFTKRNVCFISQFLFFIFIFVSKKGLSKQTGTYFDAFY